MEIKYYTCRKKYTGKHKVYGIGEPIPEIELFGNVSVQKEGQKEVKNGKNEVTRKAMNPILKIYVDSNKKKGK